MKLRIVEVFDASCSPWFRLQEQVGDNWNYINSSSSPRELESQARRMIENAVEREVVIKEFDSSAQLLVDNSAAID